MHAQGRLSGFGPVAVRTSVLAVVTFVVMSLLTLTAPTSSAAVDPCGPEGNEITCENSKPGSPASEWDISGAGDASIQGFATDISVDVGSRIDFKIDTNASAYEIDVYRTGYYGGLGARKVASVTPSAQLPQSQPQCITDAATELYDCGNWAVSASWNVPADAVSGVYIAKLTRSDNSDSSHITFVVRDDSSRSDVLFQTSDATWQAYNSYGGSNFYYGGANGRAYKVSYNRPFNTRGTSHWRDFYFSAEYPMVRFLERNGYDVSYFSDVDTDRFGSLLTNHKTFLSVGHDEYWSAGQRANVEAARDAGTNLMFLTGNEMYWKTRYERSADSSGTPYRTLVCYKETWANQKIDPSTEWTGTWRDPRFAPRSTGAGRPENSTTGTLYMSNDTDLPVTVNAEEGKLRLWRNTALASMAAGTRTELAPHTVGYESNEDLDNGARPPGLIRLSTTTGPAPEYLQDFGNSTAPGTTTHHLTLYRAGSGALVFSAGSIQWTWGLDQEHDGAGAAADPRMQQAQVNLLADMGAQPATLAGNLVPAAASTDTAKPTVTITSPAEDTTIANGTRVTATGTAADAGGRVAGVEVSTDNGKTWHPAAGTTSWSYTYVQHGNGPTPLLVRAVDDSANIGTSATVSPQVTCPCSVFGQTVPETPSSGDASPVELGLRFSPAEDGYVSGVRFYKGAGNTGTHTGSLWTADGQRLATGTFADETSAGWQELTFAEPVAVSAGATYVASYSAPDGNYAAQRYAFSFDGVDAPPLRVAGGYGADPAGVYGNIGSFPSRSHQGGNYYVDAIFRTNDDSPLTVGNHSPIPGASSVPPATTVSARFSKPLQAGTAGLELTDANGTVVDGTTAYDATTRTVTFTPSAALNGFVKHTATVTGADTTGKQVSSGGTWSFTTAKPPAEPGVCPCGLFDDTTTPSVLEAGDTAAVTLGIRFASSVDGTVTGVRFYKGPNNTGTHVGSLWSADGARLASATFTEESTTGWQTVTFPEPVEITKDTEYVASYRTTVGRYSVTPNELSSPIVRSPLRSLPAGGAYSYADGFPSSASSTSYLVDPIFEPRAPEIAVVAQDPAPGAIDVARSSSVTTWFSAPIESGYAYSVTADGASVQGSTSLSGDGTRLAFTPSDALPKGSLVQVSLAGVRSVEGAALPDQSWSFRTVDSDDAAPQTLFGDTVPQQQMADDGAAVELGTVFRPSKDGTVTALRFFKGGPANGGQHTGSLWSSSGDRLATVQYTNETPSGWQTAKLAAPVTVKAGQTYVVSYLAPQGHYSYTGGLFSQPLTSGDLTGPAGDNGRYLYGSAGGLPTYSWGSTSYFADVMFTPDPPKVSITSQSPAPGEAGVPRNSGVTVELSAPIEQSGYSLDVSHGADAVSGTTTLSADSRTLAFAPTATLPADAEITVRLTGVVSTEGASLPTTTWTFRTDADPLLSYSLFGGVTPAVAAVTDTDPVELGTAFTPSRDGSVTAVRFYKGPGNDGTHTGSLWSSTGERLATVQYANETATGWQTATLPESVPLTAGETYVVSYLAPQGRFSMTRQFFTSPWVAGPLTAPVTNGRFVYGSDGGFPVNTFDGTNYFVDVVFKAPPP